ncbi:glycoside hydrolase family 92 protein [Zopfia rhizophila CBS 207.26]|uniref:Glycoside hydrolase family 92 protein n=1 Tax=Zopfia rhizophila CBS 207.26 TaxID=1314779 RepID=A0A6A6EHJ1_9PEZI|nr:glycoside hydrolase family 92 protein [Zopfia rhizophila CBS 207.26]
MAWKTLFSLLVLSCGAAAQIDYSHYVNPFIGSEGPIPGQAFGGGDIFVGGAVPFGVIKVGIDTYEANRSISTLNGGYTPNGNVTAISMLHESGTGGFPKYGIIPQMPLTTVDATVNILDNRTYWQARVGNDTARVGYFKTQLANGVAVELSGARHAGIMQYSFPSGEKHVLVDVSHYLPSENGGYSIQNYQGGEINIAENGSTYTGYGTYGGGWNEGAPFTVYFCGEFETAPDQAQAFHGRNTDPVSRYHTYGDEPIPQATLGGKKRAAGPLNDRVGALFSWNSGDASEIRSRVGISFISTEKACSFKDSEIASWNLNDTVSASVEEWNKDVFSKIRVNTDETANQTNLVLLYSSLYFMHLMPSDRTGENPLWQSDEPYWDDFYTLWDTFRNTISLYHLIQPEAYEGQIRSLIDIWRYEGYMPDGRSGNYNGLVQGGSNADNVLADAYVKGLRGGINWTDGYAAMVKNAEVLPYNTFSLDDLTGSVKEGRGALYDWLELGYISVDRSGRCISRTVEYALNDFALSQVAKGESPGDVQKYLSRSAGWQFSWDHSVQSVNTTPIFKGFLTPKFSNGTFNSSGYNPALCGECEWSAISYEATPFEYSFVIPHDAQTLIEFMGGPSEFESRLDYIFLPSTSQQNLGANGVGIDTIMNIGNEPDFATPYLYNYINKQWKSVQRSRTLANRYFHNAPYGVPGNSDAGALNSWLIWQMLGIYPIVTQPIYLLESPWFSDINITINRNCTLRITATGLSEESYYVQSVKINEQNWNRNWFEHEDVMVEGGTIEFVLGGNASIWETGEVPPSPGHVELGRVGNDTMRK